MKEFTAFRTTLQESIEDLEEHSVLQGAMPPNILILRRKTVRLFPGGTMVALYYNDKLDQYFSIPYGGDVETTITPASLKEEELDEAKKLNSSQLRVQRVAKKQREAAEREDLEDAEAENSHKEMAWKKRRINEAVTRTAQYSPMPGNKHWHDAVSHLKKVANFETSEPIRHKDTQRSRVDPTTAKALLAAHDALSDDNKKKFVDHLEHSREKFHKMVDFAWKQVK